MDLEPVLKSRALGRCPLVQLFFAHTLLFNNTPLRLSGTGHGYRDDYYITGRYDGLYSMD